MKGTLLLAEPFMKDPNFKRKVVLICEHSKDGSFGFIINQPEALSIQDLLDDLGDFNAPLFYGGPVQQDTLHFLHVLGKELEGSIEITKGVYWGGSFEDVKRMAQEKRLSAKNIRFFLGYSGWGEGQLQEEMREKSWILHPAQAQHIFSSSKMNMLWASTLREKGGDYAMMANFPEDPRYN